MASVAGQEPKRIDQLRNKNMDEQDAQDQRFAICDLRAPKGLRGRTKYFVNKGLIRLAPSG